MKVSDLLESRHANWRELEWLCSRMEGGSQRTLDAPAVARFAALYRAACADLALADAYQLPHDTIQYLHRLVGRAHNQLYRSQTFQFRAWLRQLMVDVPQQLFADNALRLAFCIFWGLFGLSMYLAYGNREYSDLVLTEAGIDQLEQMYAQPLAGRDPGASGGMAGLYVWNNAGIGLKCFAFGMLFGVGGLYMTATNAVILGACFGHMASAPQRENFVHFVTAHGPFELTAIVLLAAAGMRLGFSMIYTHGLSRLASLEQAGREAVPTMSAGVILFTLAALIEGFLSPSAMPYPLKVAVAVASVLLMLTYFVVLGYPRRV